jgi:predicted ArsR family transcriptional regulator
MRTLLTSDRRVQILRDIGVRIARQVSMPNGASYEERLEVAAKFLNGRGYLARWESDGASYLLHLSNCPYEQVALIDPVVCELDMALVTHLLGTDPERTAWSVGEDRHCTYAIPRQLDAS